MPRPRLSILAESSTIRGGSRAECDVQHLMADVLAGELTSVIEEAGREPWAITAAVVALSPLRGKRPEAANVIHAMRDARRLTRDKAPRHARR